MNRKKLFFAFLLLAVLLTVFSVASCSKKPTEFSSSVLPEEPNIFSYSDVPEYSGEPYVTLNSGLPYFSSNDLTAEAFESYSPLDILGRCGAAYACICRELMPTEDRESIGMIKPSGWQTAKYDFVDGKYLYNRCHLIGFQLAGENANEKNLITGTRHMNTEGMLPFENMIADYVKETDNHVLYRVTPVFSGMELVARGVLMEAFSVEDDGDGVCFCVFAYNVQPGVTVNYANGDNELEEAESNTSNDTSATEYILNTNTKKYHLPTCDSVKDMNEKNKGTYTGSKEKLSEMGYSPCGSCKP